MNRSDRRRQGAQRRAAPSYAAAIAALRAMRRDLDAMEGRTRRTEAKALGRAIALIETWEATGRPSGAARTALLDGSVRLMLAKAHPEATEPDGTVACQMGCAWCCADPNPIAVAEAEVAAVARATADKPDGRSWHPNACPALDPSSRACQAYEDRPLVCRGFYSTDERACERVVDGGPNSAARYSTYEELSFAVHAAALALARRSPPRYELRRALGAIRDGRSLADALALARLPD